MRRIVGEALIAAVKATSEKYPAVCGDSASLEWIAAAFVSVETEVLILTKDRFYRACRIYKPQPLLYMTRVYDLLAADERRLVSYSKKRIPCSCLDAKFREVKSWSKLGRSSNLYCGLPERKVELRAMMSCGGCRRSLLLRSMSGR